MSANLDLRPALTVYLPPEADRIATAQMVMAALVPILVAIDIHGDVVCGHHRSVGVLKPGVCDDCGEDLTLPWTHDPRTCAACGRQRAAL